MLNYASSFKQDLCDWDVEYSSWSGDTYTDITADCNDGALCGNSDDGLSCV